MIVHSQYILSKFWLGMFILNSADYCYRVKFDNFFFKFLNDSNCAHEKKMSYEHARFS